MGRVVAVHSRRGGTGKTTLTAAAGGLAAAAGLRVGLVDVALQSPALHRLFGIGVAPGDPGLAGFLSGRCEIEEAVHEVPAGAGVLLLVPAGGDRGEADRLLLSGYDLGLVTDACLRLRQRHRLDLLLLDTHPGTGAEASLSVALADAVLRVVRPDGGGEDAPPGERTLLVVNQVPAGMSDAEAGRGLPAEPVAIVPYDPALGRLDGSGPTVPAHPHRHLRDLAALLTS